MKTKPTYLLATACGLFALVQTACDKADSPGEPNASPSAATESASPEIEATFVDSEPADAVSVIEARRSVEPGSTLTVTGRIAGAMEPFSADYATFILADETLETCERIPGDSCPTPWDACCVEQKTIAASRLTVQVVGEDGRPIGQSLKEVSGLKELDGITVTGTVAEGSSEENLILNATGIYPKGS